MKIDKIYGKKANMENATSKLIQNWFFFKVFLLSIEHIPQILIWSSEVISFLYLYAAMSKGWKLKENSLVMDASE